MQIKLPTYNPYNEFERKINPSGSLLEPEQHPHNLAPKGYIQLRSQDGTFIITLPKNSELITEFLDEGCTLRVSPFNTEPHEDT